jgi:hypothetical protein
MGRAILYVRVRSAADKTRIIRTERASSMYKVVSFVELRLRASGQYRNLAMGYHCSILGNLPAKGWCYNQICKKTARGPCKGETHSEGVKAFGKLHCTAHRFLIYMQSLHCGIFRLHQFYDTSVSISSMVTIVRTLTRASMCEMSDCRYQQ